MSNPQVSHYFPHLRVFPDTERARQVLEMKSKNRAYTKPYTHVAQYKDGTRGDLRFNAAVFSKLGGYIDLLDVTFMCDYGLMPGGLSSEDQQNWWTRTARWFAEKEMFS